MECDAFIELHVMKMEQLIHHIEIFMLECCKIYGFLPCSFFFVLCSGFRAQQYPLWCVNVLKLAWRYIHSCERKRKREKDKISGWMLNQQDCLSLFWTFVSHFILFSFSNATYMLFSCIIHCWDLFKFSWCCKAFKWIFFYSIYFVFWQVGNKTWTKDLDLMIQCKADEFPESQ